jgi:tRNA-dihydrouridine synthase
MVLLHFGHALQVGQFLSPLTNKRTDKFGGDLENRARYPMMIINRIREKVGRKLLIEVRISGSEFEKGGIEIEEAIEFTKMIQDKIDLIHVSAGMHNDIWMTVTHPCDFLPPTPNVFLAEAVKKAGVKIPVVTIGGIQNLDGAEKIIEDGRADVVSIARGFIADPELGKKAYEGKGEDVTPCIKCVRCIDSVIFGHHFSCSVNPTIGFEHKLSELLLEMEKEDNLRTLPSARCTEITQSGVSYLDKDRKEENIPTDNIIVATGMNAKQEQAEKFRPYAHRFVAIGDCARAANVEKAIHSAFYAASQI